MFSNAQGFYVGTALADKTFYGFRLNAQDGNLTAEVINDGTSVVELPQVGIVDPVDYKHWIWSADTLSFRWGNKGHLLMEVL
jgi:hypothetical protein